jgi:hypothetical protein
MIPSANSLPSEKSNKKKRSNMQFSSSEILNNFSVPEGVTVHRASYLKASKTKKLPRAEICFSYEAGMKIKKQNNMAVDANFEHFQAAIGDLIVSLAPMPSASKNSTNSDQQIQNKIQGSRIRLRYESVSLPSKKSRTRGGSRPGSGRKSNASKKKKLCWQERTLL